MMNQKVGIYIILSAILLYLYYRRNDLAIFAAFVAVVGGTLIFRDHLQNDDREGFGMGGGGGGGGGDCAKMGFKPIKLDKDDLPGSLEKVYNSIKKVVDKHWPYFDDDTSTSNKDAVRVFMDVVKTSAAKLDKDDKKRSDDFLGSSYEFYSKKKMDYILTQKPERLKNYISGGEITLKLLEKLSKSDEIDADFKKKNFKYLNCLCKYWITLYKEVLKATGGGGGDDEEEKSKKKASEDDEGGGDDEEEKPKKKKKATEDGDDEEEEKPKKKKKATEDDEE
jgi:hypothetical protein